MEPELPDHLWNSLLQFYPERGDQVCCKPASEGVLDPRAGPKDSDGGLLAREEGSHSQRPLGRVRVAGEPR